MLYSMTGFGRAEGMVHGRQVTVEIKSLNGKGFDITTKLSPALRVFELDIRSLMSASLQRGTVDLSATVRSGGTAKPMVVNTDLAAHYYQGMLQVAERIGVPMEDVLPTLMRMPEVVAADTDVLPEEEWEEVKTILEAAAAELMRHRQHEGAALEKDLRQRMANIMEGLEQILPLESQRSQRIRSRIQNSLQELIGNDKIDPNRFEQEIIYYLERMDFTEEKTRLTQHCRYFLSLLDANEQSVGKKLNFVLQEIGREINTLGSKANDADIQQYVVGMKDELEKAKEQVLNIL
jgi:uncharacterized protein (TIGR00255 family)